MVDIKSKADLWKKDFGTGYIDRNKRDAKKTDNFSMRAFGITRTDLFRKAIDKTKPESALEIGCNVGQNFPLLLSLLNKLKLTGVEINLNAALNAKKDYPQTNIVQAMGFYLPFINKCCDLVFTAGVLIHIHPDDLGKVVDEMWRISDKYILGLEYHSEKLEHVVYHGQDGLLWKQDFEKVFTGRFKNAVTVYSDIYEYNEEIFGQKGLFYKVYLIKKM